jgi:quinol monooxygenase YgiN
MTSITEASAPGTEATADHSKRPIVLASIMLATFMVAMEATIVATAMPRIVGELGGFTFYTWVFSAYLLAQCTMTLIFGKLSDVFGRKPIMIAGLLIFLAGSLLAGFAESMAWLIGFRLLQGIGAGAIQPVTPVGRSAAQWADRRAERSPCDGRKKDFRDADPFRSLATSFGREVIPALARRYQMDSVTFDPAATTLVNVLTCEPANQAALVALLRENTDTVIVTLDGWRSTSLVAAGDGTRVVIISQWRDPAAVRAMQGDARMKAYFPRIAALAAFASTMGDVVHARHA